MIDNSVILSNPARYHFTVFWCSRNVDIDRLKNAVEEAVAREPLSFEVRGFLFAPVGISLKLYPRSDNFNELRERLAELAGVPYKLDERGVTSWITVARWSNPPKSELKKYVQGHADWDFGVYTPKTIGFYRSKNKNFEGAVEVTTVENR